jgi:alanyl-tRNA synthetase
MVERLYYAEPFLVSFTSHVSDIREVSRSKGQTLWQISLERTAFYPTSGGQPHDTGQLKAIAPSGATLYAPILAVEEDENGEIWHTTPKPLLAGTAVEGELDWIRRRDNMQQHSGQHLLSAVFHRETGAAIISFHLGKMTSTIDLAVDAVSTEELERVEKTVNEKIAEDRAVRIRIIPRSEAEALLASGDLRKLPERDGAIRLIEIEGVDLNACGGTHVSSTGQIGCLLIRGTERVSGGVRIEFVCGLRASQAARLDFSTLNRVARTLSTGHLQLPEAVDRLLSENKALHKERLRLSEELVDYHAARLAVEEPIDHDLRIVRREFAAHDAAYIKLLASRVTAAAPQTFVLLASTAQEPAKVVVASSHDLEIDCAAALREALGEFGGRGGGSAEMAQGQIASNHLDALFSRLAAAVRTGANRRGPATSA